MNECMFYKGENYKKQCKILKCDKCDYEKCHFYVTLDDYIKKINKINRYIQKNGKKAVVSNGKIKLVDIFSEEGTELKI